MCGICGAFGQSDPYRKRILVRENENRGRDAVGFLADGKRARFGESITSVLKSSSVPPYVWNATTFLAHTRAASQVYGVSRDGKLNAHPFKWGAICGAHNGYFRNWEKFKTEHKELADVKVDSSVFYFLISKHGPQEAISRIAGYGACWWQDLKDQNVVWFYCYNQDLNFGEDGKEVAFSSQPEPLQIAGYKSVGAVSPDGTLFTYNISERRITLVEEKLRPFVEPTASPTPMIGEKKSDGHTDTSSTEPVTGTDNTIPVAMSKQFRGMWMYNHSEDKFMGFCKTCKKIYGLVDTVDGLPLIIRTTEGQGVHHLYGCPVCVGSDGRHGEVLMKVTPEDATKAVIDLAEDKPFEINRDPLSPDKIRVPSVKKGHGVWTNMAFCDRIRPDDLLDLDIVYTYEDDGGKIINETAQLSEVMSGYDMTILFTDSSIIQLCVTNGKYERFAKFGDYVQRRGFGPFFGGFQKLESNDPIFESMATHLSAIKVICVTPDDSDVSLEGKLKEQV
jgi:hypothetical protein